MWGDIWKCTVEKSQNTQWRKVKIHSGEKSKCTVEKSKLGQLGKKKAGAVIRFEKTNAFFPPAAAAACYFSRQVKSWEGGGKAIITERDKSFQHFTFQYSRWVESLKCSVYAYFVVFVCLFIGSWLAHSATGVWHKVEKWTNAFSSGLCNLSRPGQKLREG